MAAHRIICIVFVTVLCVVTVTSGVPVSLRHRRTVQDSPNTGDRIRHDNVPNSEQDLAIGGIDDAPVLDVDAAAIAEPLTPDDGTAQPRQAFETEHGSDTDLHASDNVFDPDVVNTDGSIAGARDSQALLDTDEGVAGRISFDGNGSSIQQPHNDLNVVEPDPDNIERHGDSSGQQIGNEQGLGGGTQPDGTQPDGTLLDGTHPDGTLLDGTHPDGTQPDGSQPDGPLLDGTHPDGTQPDGTLLDGTHLDGTQPDGTQPDGTVGRRDIDELGQQNRTFESHFLLTEHRGDGNKDSHESSVIGSGSHGVPETGGEVITGIQPGGHIDGGDEHTHEHIPVEQITTPRNFNREEHEGRVTSSTSTRVLDNSQGTGDVHGEGGDHSENTNHSGDSELIHEQGAGSGEQLQAGSQHPAGGHVNPDGGYVIHEGSGSNPEIGGHGNIAIDKDDGNRPNRAGSGEAQVPSTTMYPISEPYTPRLAILPTPAQVKNGETQNSTYQTTPYSIDSQGEIHSSGDNPSESISGDHSTENHPERPSEGNLISGEGHIGTGTIHEGSGHEGIHEGSGTDEETGENKEKKPDERERSTTLGPNTSATTVIPVFNPASVRTQISLFPSSSQLFASVKGSSVLSVTLPAEESTSTSRLSVSSSFLTEAPLLTESVWRTPYVHETDTLAYSLYEIESSQPGGAETSDIQQAHTVQVSKYESLTSETALPIPGVPVYKWTASETVPSTIEASFVTERSLSEELKISPSPSLSLIPSTTSVIEPESKTTISSAEVMTSPGSTILSSQVSPASSPVSAGSSSVSQSNSTIPTTERGTTLRPETGQPSEGTNTSRTTATRWFSTRPSDAVSTFTNGTTLATEGLTSRAVSHGQESSNLDTGTSTATARTRQTNNGNITTRAAPVLTFASTTTIHMGTSTPTTTHTETSTTASTGETTSMTVTTRGAPVLTFASTTLTGTGTTRSTDYTTLLMATTKKPLVKSTEKPPEEWTTTQPQNQLPLTGRWPGTTPETVTLKNLQPETSTPPPLFITIEIRMSWQEFCSKKPNFIASLQEIIRTEKQVIVRDEQIRLPNLPLQYCRPDLMVVDTRVVGNIHVQMYIVDEAGKVDVRLTIDAYTVLGKGFTDAIFKGKILNVQVVKSDEESPDVEPRGGKRESGITMVIVIASVGGFCCLMLILLQVILIHRRVKAKAKLKSPAAKRLTHHSDNNVALGAMSKSRPGSGYWNPALEDDDGIAAFEYSHVLNYSTLANSCMDVNAIYEEFQNIPCENSGLTKLFVGENEKNRFANVLSHSHSRVKLKMREGDTSDYINASYIKGYRSGKDTYIATQSPLVNTVEDFWRMIWEQQSRTIIMLNTKLPSGKYKQSTCYWPDNEELDSTREYGDFIIAVKKRIVHKDYIECVLEITDIEKNLKRELHHFLLTCWPDGAAPEPLSIIKFVLDTRPHYEDIGGPPIVHCGPGTGRTGTLIAVDICMRMYEARKHVDLLNSVYRMRKDRLGMVQTKEQYALIYQALNEYAVILGSPSISSRSSVITLHNML